MQLAPVASVATGASQARWPYRMTSVELVSATGSSVTERPGRQNRRRPSSSTGTRLAGISTVGAAGSTTSSAVETAVTAGTAVIRPATVLFEVDGVTEVEARESLRLAATKLPIKTKFISRHKIG